MSFGTIPKDAGMVVKEINKPGIFFLIGIQRSDLRRNRNSGIPRYSLFLAGICCYLLFWTNNMKNLNALFKHTKQNIYIFKLWLLVLRCNIRLSCKDPSKLASLFFDFAVHYDFLLLFSTVGERYLNYAMPLASFARQQSAAMKKCSTVNHYIFVLTSSSNSCNISSLSRLAGSGSDRWLLLPVTSDDIFDRKEVEWKSLVLLACWRRFFVLSVEGDGDILSNSLVVLVLKEETSSSSMNLLGNLFFLTLLRRLSETIVMPG